MKRKIIEKSNIKKKLCTVEREYILIQKKNYISLISEYQTKTFQEG